MFRKGLRSVLRYYSTVCLEGLRTSMKNLSQDSLPSDVVDPVISEYSYRTGMTDTYCNVAFLYGCMNWFQVSHNAVQYSLL